MPWPQQERVRNVFESVTCFATVSGLELSSVYFEFYLFFFIINMFEEIGS